MHHVARKLSLNLVTHPRVYIDPVLSMSLSSCLHCLFVCRLTLHKHYFEKMQWHHDGPQPCVFLGTLTVEQIYQDRDQFASLVREVAAPDVGRMGIEILSFTIKVSGL